jgi:tetraacyldisaccharide 4'-kinase
MLPLSLLFGALVATRRFVYRIVPPARLPVPVIVVGNITTGGTGKTPLVIMLARELRKFGWNPGVVSRGYRGKNSTAREIAADVIDAGDEPPLIARKSAAPVWIGRRRAAAARALLRAHPRCDVVISDDGLQHYALARDLEIAVIDGARRFGNRFLLPAGPLREPMSRLGGVSALVVNGGELIAGAGLPPQFAMRLRGETFCNVSRAEVTARAGDFRGKRVHAIAAIGNPQHFFDTLTALGLDFTTRAFPDHHRFTPSDFETDADVILMTEKDAVKCAAFARSHWWALAAEAEVSRDFLEFLNHKLNGLKAARHSGVSAV